jgi:hypothetical protein
MIYGVREHDAIVGYSVTRESNGYAIWLHRFDGEGTYATFHEYSSYRDAAIERGVMLAFELRRAQKAQAAA